MKNTVMIMAATAMLTACGGGASRSGECHIHGELDSDKWDGQYIFFVPMYDKEQIGVDSVKIKGRTFDFTTDKSCVSDIRLSWRTRYGTQNLLVVYEPGDVSVKIDSVSSGGGTPLNDSLEAWKERSSQYNETAEALNRAARNFAVAGDTAAAKAMKAQARAAYGDYKAATVRLADSTEGTPLAKFLNIRVLNRE